LKQEKALSRMENLATKLKCVTCSREYNLNKNNYLCLHCGNKLYGEFFTFPGILEVEYDYDKARRILLPMERPIQRALS